MECFFVYIYHAFLREAFNQGDLSLTSSLVKLFSSFSHLRHFSMSSLTDLFTFGYLGDDSFFQAWEEFSAAVSVSLLLLLSFRSLQLPCRPSPRAPASTGWKDRQASVQLLSFWMISKSLNVLFLLCSLRLRGEELLWGEEVLQLLRLSLPPQVLTREQAILLLIRISLDISLRISLLVVTPLCSLS